MAEVRSIGTAFWERMAEPGRYQISEGSMRGFVTVVVYREEAKTRFRSLLSARSGATAMEYALLGALIGVAILASVAFYAGNVSDMFIGIATEVTE